MDWALRYTFHTGYEPPAFPSQFRATLGGDDPVALVRLASDHGAAGVLYPWAPDRPQDEVERVSAALKDTGLASSCIVIGDGSLLFRPIWTDRSVPGRATLSAAVQRSCVLASALNAQIIVAFPVTDSARSDEPERQEEDLVANLIEMSHLANAHGCAIGIEPMLLPGLMLQSFGAARDIIGRVDRRDVGLIFDTAHVATMSEELLPAFRAAYEQIVLLQLADLPGRVEPGAGTLDLVTIATEAIMRGYAGLVDLEHGWIDPSAQGEADGLARLRSFDAQVGAAALARRNEVTSIAARPN